MHYLQGCQCYGPQVPDAATKSNLDPSSSLIHLLLVSISYLAILQTRECRSLCNVCKDMTVSSQLGSQSQLATFFVLLNVAVLHIVMYLI